VHEIEIDDVVVQALRDKTIYRVEGGDGKARQWQDPALLAASVRIPEIEKLVKEIVQSSEVLFSRKTDAENPERDRFHSQSAGKRFLGLLRIDMEEIEACFPNNTFNSYFEVFRKHTNDYYLKSTLSWHQSLHGEDLVKWVEALNACIESIRQTVRTKEFSAAIKTRQRGANKNHKALLDYIDSLFAAHTRMLVLRIDFGYKTQALYGKEFQTSVDFPKIKEQHTQLIKHLKTKMFKDSFLGFASKFEYGLAKGYHFHSLIFLNGAINRIDVVIGKIIGECWNTTLTEGNGLYYNCNGHKERYKLLGIGTINNYDVDLMSNLKEYVAPYLNKTDYFIKLITPDKSRAFIKGNMIKPKAKKRGRPRSRTPDRLEDSFSPSVPK
jgi:Inovirus Gp2